MTTGEALAPTPDGVVALAEAGLQDLRVLVVAAGAIHRSEAQEVGQEVEAVLGGERFRVELHAPDRELAVAQPHDEAVVRPGGDFQAGGEGVALHHQRMVAGRVERIGQALEHIGAAMEDRRGLAVHQVRGADDAAAEDMADGLMTEAHAQDWLLAREGLDHIAGDPSLGRRARAG